MKLQKNQLTVRELELMFNVTNRTVVNWREGSARITPLPFHKVPRFSKDRIYFKYGEVKNWAAKNNIEMMLSIDYIISLRKERD